MQIEDELGHVLNQSKVNRASDQVVREMYMCPTEESQEEDNERISQSMLDALGLESN